MSKLSYFTNKTILITGGTGYLGSALATRLRSVCKKLILLSRKKILSEVYQADITQPDLWEKILPGVDIVFHLAAQTSSKFANEHPLEDTKVNLLPVIRLVQTCQSQNLYPDIIFAGTSTQVGFTQETPINELKPDKPITIYDINKLTAEKYLIYYSNQLGNKAVSLRLTNVYGPGSSSSREDRGILNLMVKKALAKEPLTIYGEGTQLRDYIFIDDVVNAFLTAAVEIDKLKGEYYIIGSGKGHPIKEMVKIVQSKVAQKTDYKVDITHIPFPPGTSQIEFRNFVADITKFHKTTGWKPEIDLANGIKKTIEFFI